MGKCGEKELKNRHPFRWLVPSRPTHVSFLVTLTNREMWIFRYQHGLCVEWSWIFRFREKHFHFPHTKKKWKKSKILVKKNKQRKSSRSWSVWFGLSKVSHLSLLNSSRFCYFSEGSFGISLVKKIIFLRSEITHKTLSPILLVDLSYSNNVFCFVIKFKFDFKCPQWQHCIQHLSQLHSSSNATLARCTIRCTIMDQRHCRLSTPVKLLKGAPRTRRSLCK